VITFHGWLRAIKDIRSQSLVQLMKLVSIFLLNASKERTYKVRLLKGGFKSDNLVSYTKITMSQVE